MMLRDLARASLVDRHGFAVAADKVDAIAITRAGKSAAEKAQARAHDSLFIDEQHGNAYPQSLLFDEEPD